MSFWRLVPFQRFLFFFFWCLSMTDFPTGRSLLTNCLFLSDDGDTLDSPAVWQKKKKSRLRPGIFGTCGTCGGGCTLSCRIPLRGGAWDPKDLFWCHIFNCLHLRRTSVFLHTVTLSITCKCSFVNLFGSGPWFPVRPSKYGGWFQAKSYLQSLMTDRKRSSKSNTHNPQCKPALLLSAREEIMGT